MTVRAYRWMAKAMVQKAVSATGTVPLYHWAQKRAGRLKNFHPKGRIEYAQMIGADIGLERVQGATVVEIGTGWVPIIPMGLFLLGARRILSYDLTRHLLPDVTMQSVRQLPGCVPPSAKLEALLAAPDFAALARIMGLEYNAPADVTASDIPPGSVDVVYSNLVFEHVTPQALTAILEHSRRILKPTGVAWHHVDYSDHYAHTFKDLSLIHFLRYSDRAWNWLGQSSLHYQNRLRRSDYVRAFEAAGFKVGSVQDVHGVSEAEALAAPLARPCDLPDLTCTSSRFVLHAREI